MSLPPPPSMSSKKSPRSTSHVDCRQKKVLLPFSDNFLCCFRELAYSTSWKVVPGVQICCLGAPYREFVLGRPCKPPISHPSHVLSSGEFQDQLWKPLQIPPADTLSSFQSFPSVALGGMLHATLKNDRRHT